MPDQANRLYRQDTHFGLGEPDYCVEWRRLALFCTFFTLQQEASDDSFTTFFSETGSGKYVPRYGIKILE